MFTQRKKVKMDNIDTLSEVRHKDTGMTIEEEMYIQFGGRNADNISKAKKRRGTVNDKGL